VAKNGIVREVHGSLERVRRDDCARDRQVPGSPWIACALHAHRAWRLPNQRWSNAPRALNRAGRPLSAASSGRSEASAKLV
jgi:hypothetical protein